MSPIKRVVIYCRYSSDMQWADSCADQERAVRVGLTRLSIPSDGAIVITDEAESGTKSDRNGFQRLLGMIGRGEVAVLGVDDQSRLTRAGNAYSFVQDLVFAGGRFVSVGEGIDTAVDGWEMKVQVMQLHHGQTVRDLQHRVHRGQKGRVLDDGSAGDFPFGYVSYYLDPNWQTQIGRRGPKPKKGVKVCADEADRVKQVFAWFVAGKSIGWIARELTRLKVAKGRRSSTAGWRSQQVRQMLGNAKYIGRWVWGKTTTRRDSAGRKKQVAVSAGQQVIRDRPELRIVEQEVWGRAARLVELNGTFGVKDGQKPRGPKANPADVYPRSPLGGLLVCAACECRMYQHRSGERRYYACVGARKGLCGMTTQVPAGWAERALTGFVLDLLGGWPEWAHELYRRTCAAIHSAVDRVPAERERDTRRAAELDRQIRNLVSALADSGLTSAAVNQRLREAEEEKATVDARLAAAVGLDTAMVDLPDEGWVAEHLSAWAVQAADRTGSQSLVRLAVAGLTAESVIAPGKKRGYSRLRFRVNAWAALTAALGEALPASVRPFLADPAIDIEEAPKFVLDLGEPTEMDAWTPKIVEWRATGVKWKEIVERTGMGLNRVYRAWKRSTGASGELSLGE